MSQEKQIPFNLEAEESIIGGILIKPDALSKVVDIIAPDDFYKGAHRIIYDEMLKFYEKGEVIDSLLLAERLKKQDKLEQIGGEETLYTLAEAVPTAANIFNYAKIVKEKSTLRKIINVGTKIVEIAYEGYEEVDQILDKSENMIFKIAQNKENKEVVSVKDLVDEEFKRLETVYANKGEVTGISSGFTEFDRMLSGFHPSDLIIIAARPSMGKTAFALNLALNAGVHEDKGVLIFSLEMSNSQIFQRLIAADARVQLNKIRNGFLQPEEWQKLGISTGRLAESPIYIADVPNVTVMEIRTIARRLKAENKLDMILIDYLQLISGRSGGGESRQQEISEISRSLKGLARELDVPVIALSQLSRAPEQRSDRRPMLSDLRDSGAIEQDADAVIFLYRDDYYNEDSELKGIAEIIIGKQRNGPVGTVHLRFFNEITKFENYTMREE
ncbi:replicative DNA helicase [Haliovirga abyssi]|uniref:Replicative DNA helicase n=1 Tax=Haliovirga abyssi TaxID=2996794 RepID=A0AAU9DHF2_9FUSO|nr:replicative DNA helicase [Haliovirga abyssi]BDU50962.1 replicative DNA helicase [Haliovirga abyssi]